MYATLVETNGKEQESWYYFIKYEGNEESLNYLNDQLNSVDMYILGELSTFDLDIKNLVSEETAKAMTKLEVNSVMFHRKFDGKLKKINFKLEKAKKNKHKIVRIFRKLGLNQIENFAEDEDISESDEQEYNSENSEKVVSEREMSSDSEDGSN